MQAEPTANCSLLAMTPASNQPACWDVLKHARGFLERDLRPESLWTTASSKTCNASHSFETASSSSSDKLPKQIDDIGKSSYDPIEVLRHTDIANNVEFFLGPPGPLQAKVPQSYPFSKVRSLANVAEYVLDWPVSPAKAESASGGSCWVRKPSVSDHAWP